MLIELKEIRELLVLNEWTREQLGKNLGINRQTIDRWFIEGSPNQRHPSAEHARKMLEWLGEARDRLRSTDERLNRLTAAAS